MPEPKKPKLSPPLEIRLGVNVAGKDFVWAERMDGGSRQRREARASALRLLRLSAFVVGTLLFAIPLAAWLTSTLGIGFSQAFRDSFLRPSGTGALFWLSLLFLCFAFFLYVSSKQHAIEMPPHEPDAPRPDIEDAPATTSRLNVADLFGEEAMRALSEAQEIAERYGHAKIAPLHLFSGALATTDAGVAFARLGIKFDSLKEPLIKRLGVFQAGPGPTLSREAEETLLSAFLNAWEQGRQEVDALEVFYEAYKRDEFARELLFDLGTDEKRLANVVAWIRITAKMREKYEQFRKAAFFKPTGAMNRSMTAIATPTLDAVSEDLTAAAVAGRLPLVVGRERELEGIFRVIEGGGQSVLLVGPEGVGKSAVLAGVAALMVEERVPDLLKDRRFVSISVPYLISGATPAQAQERLLRVLSEAARAGNVIIAFQNVEQLTGLTPGGEATADLAAVLTDVLNRGVLFAIGTTTPDAYAKSIEGTVLGRAFEKVMVEEPERDAAIHILESKIGGIEYENDVIFSYEAVEQAVSLSDRYLHESYLPKKAIEICKETALHVAKTRGKGALVSGEDVAGIISDKTRIPVTEVTADEREKLLGLEDRMAERMVGQEEAVRSVAGALRRARAELRADDRPIATFLFLGPTGVGKTELAKTVAETYFGSESNMLRFDMSEYQDASSIHRLIGRPGDKAGGLLTEAVRQNPFAIVLLDEFEKAHPDILNVFLQVFDDGRLTDAAGRTIDFANTILIATSNAGAEYIQDAVKADKDIDDMRTELIEERLKGIYRPELLNRFDGIILFKPLTQEEIGRIAELMIAKVAKRLEPRGIGFRASDAALAELVDKGYDPKFGARPLRRVIQEEVEGAIANALLEGKVGRRDVIVLKAGGEIEIEKAPEL